MFGDVVVAALERVTERDLGFQTFAADSIVGNVDPPAASATGYSTDATFDARVRS
jgi:hypothetical protein